VSAEKSSFEAECSPDSIETPAQLGNFLRGLRGRLTQAAMARRATTESAMLTRQRISNIENGQLPTEAQLACFLHACGKRDSFDGLNVVRRELQLAREASDRQQTHEQAQQQTTAADKKQPTGKKAPLSRFSILLVLAVFVLVVSAAFAMLAIRQSSHSDGAAQQSVQTVSTPECGEGFICFWSEPDFHGMRLQQSPDFSSASRCVRLPFTVRSVRNNTKERQRVYANSDCSDLGTIIQNLGGTDRFLDVNAYKHT
jgi:transcriptional regulator with XRE-family HTH domain